MLPSGPSPSTSTKPSVAGLVLVGVGSLALVLSLLALDWVSFDNEFTSASVGFADLHDAVSASDVGGVAGFYFTWLAWVLFAGAVVFGVGSCLPRPAQVASRVLGVLTVGGGVVLTFLALETDGGGAAFADRSVGFWAAVVGFVLVGIGCLIPSPKAVASLPNYGLPAEQQRFANQYNPNAPTAGPFGGPAPSYAAAVVAPQPPAAPVPVAPPAGWHPDPAGRYELRYWDGTGWTAHVSNRGVAAFDPL